MTNKKLLLSSLFIGIVHFIIVTVSGKYVATQIGTQMGQVVSGGIINSLETKGQDPEKEAKANYEGMQAQGEDIFTKWRVPLIFLSIPAKLVFNPLLANIRSAQMGKLKAKEISKDQFLSRLKITEIMANIINSLSLALLIYFGVNLYKKHKIN